MPIYEPRSPSLSDFIKTLTLKPGVYRFLDLKGNVLYVGKARSLKKRVQQYFSRGAQAPKTQALVKQVAEIEVTVTKDENEALLLESNLIKKLRPKFNVLLKDDKSYPFIFVSTQDPFPRLALHRGAKQKKGRYFGPYPQADAARKTIYLLQGLFRIRSCEDTFFKHRTRPCLQYQIKRCTAPCVGYIQEADYRSQIEHVLLFLEGKSQEIITQLGLQMQAYANERAFEQAAFVRDQIRALSQVTQKQHITAEAGDVDIIAIAEKHGTFCVHVTHIRGGQSLGGRAYFPKTPEEESSEEVLSAFIAQFYLKHPVPKEALVNILPTNATWLSQTLSQSAGRQFAFVSEPKGTRGKWLEMGLKNANLALSQRLSMNVGFHEKWGTLVKDFGLDAVPKRIVCFDISHHGGEDPVGAAVVFGKEGAERAQYRRFNIREVKGGDDYAAIRQAIRRYLTHIKTKAPDTLPDLILIDGGKGQLNEGLKALADTQTQEVLLLAIAKGPERKSGKEVYWHYHENKVLAWHLSDPSKRLFEQIRDEAHRFAISGNRKQLTRTRKTSLLETIEGVGPSRREALLKHFGGLETLKKANPETLAKVDGISYALAWKIYNFFHQD